MRIYRIHFGQKLKAARKSAGLTQENLSEKVGVEPSTVSRWESGNDFPDDSRIPKIIKALSVSKDYFEISNNEVKRIGLMDAADFLSRFASLPPKLQQIVLALVYQNPNLYGSLPPDVEEMLTQSSKVR